MKTSAKWKITKWINPEYIEPVNSVQDKEFVKYLVETFENEGWNGRPILAIKYPAIVQDGYAAITGSHRIYAARKAKIKIPIYVIEESLLESWFVEDEKNIDRFLDKYGLPRVDDSSKTFLNMLKDIGDMEAVNLYREELYQNMFDNKMSSEIRERNAASLGRVLQHVQKENVDSYAMLTSWRQEKSKKENVRDFKELKNSIRSLGYGFFEIEGVGQEEDATGEVISVEEPTLFIPNITLKEASHIASKYNQFGFVYSGEEVEDNVALVTKEGTDFINKFNPMQIAKFFSRVKGKPFHFSSVKPTTLIEARWKNSQKET